MPEEGTKPIERDKDAPEHPGAGQADQAQEMVDLLGVIEDEFGLSRSRIRQEAYTGQILIDGERWSDAVEKNFLLPRSEIVGKTVELKGAIGRSFRFQVA